jgi:NAD(P)-dependent dehydrogenase (short-subunit alcohol dehydrogenase family)
MSMNHPISNWQQRRIWLIGASTGIGAACAHLLLAQGARVACSARRQDLLEQAFGNDVQALVAPLDITDHASVIAARDRICHAFGGIDLILIVAGGYQPMRADSFDLKVAKDLIELNLTGVFHCLDAALPLLLAQNANGQAGGGKGGGKGGDNKGDKPSRCGIGIVASVAGFRGLPKALVYGPTKAALINLCETLYLDLHPRGMDVYLINPGFIATPLTADNDFAMPALISADEAARQMLQGMQRGQFHIHFPRRFSNFLRLLRLLPYQLYFWLVHKGTGL